MGVIVEFRPRSKKKQSGEAKRLEAMIKGKLEVYTCDNCGGDIEVINDEFPSHCPHCNVELLEWE